LIVAIAPPTPAVSGPPFLLTPILGIQESYTDNALLTSSDRQSDFITRLMAGLNANVDDGSTVARITSQLSYDQYARNTRLSGWSVQAYGDGSVALVKNLLSLDAEGTVINGNVSEFGTSAIDRSGVADRTQLATYAVGPHLKTTVAGVEDVEAVARWDQVFYTAANGSTVNNLPVDSNIVQVAGQADTGKRLGRFELLTSSQYESDDHGFRTADGVQSVYFNLLQDLRLVGRAGYESVYVPRVTDINAPVLSAGFELTLNSRSKVTLEGGERYNRAAWAASAYLQFSDRLYATADYYEVLEPNQVYIANSFLNFVQLTTQLPTPLVPTSFAVNGNLYDQASLNQTADARVVYTWPRQKFAVSTSWIDQDFFKSATHDRTLVAQATFTRQLQPDLEAGATASYIRTFSSPVFGPSEIYAAEGTVVYNVNSTVDLNAGYAFDHEQEFTGPRQTIYENVVFVSLQKRF
jgi:uncharacterized protein (PEP-CTERM system associated)